VFAPRTTRAATLFAVLVACLAGAPAPAPASAAQRAKPCRLALHDEQLPGGTAAYAVTVSARRVSCAIATRVMRAFHRCRGDGHSRCHRRLLGSWHCAGIRRPGPPLGQPIVFFGSADCRSGPRRVTTTYQDNFPACYGAAARDPLHPCANTTTAMYPDFDDVEEHAFDNGSSGCDPGIVEGACTSGVDEPVARRHVALIGDSHTFHWRAALALVAQVESWRVYSISAGGCFFSAVTGAFLQDCESYYNVVLDFLRRHPEVDTVFQTSNADTPVAVPEGQTTASYKIGGFLDGWAALPPTVKHVVVLRDTTASTDERFSCMSAALTDGRRPGIACALARPLALREDYAFDAVQQAHNPRLQAIDLSHFFCGSEVCYPVIGGVRVNADIFGHLTPTYMRTLGPYLLRALRRLQARW
jgi:hypothetical protein